MFTLLLLFLLIFTSYVAAHGGEVPPIEQDMHNMDGMDLSSNMKFMNPEVPN